MRWFSRKKRLSVSDQLVAKIKEFQDEPAALEAFKAELAKSVIVDRPSVRDRPKSIEAREREKLQPLIYAVEQAGKPSWVAYAGLVLALVSVGISVVALVTE